MKIQPKKADEDVEIDMSPMIDMVFLLLIFFIVASTVIEEKVPVKNIPTAVHATLKPPDDTINRAVISINEDEELFFGIRTVPITEEELLAYLQEAMANAAAQNVNLRVMIRCDGNVKYEVNEKVMAICGEAGAMDLIYAAFEGAEGDS